MIVCDPESLPSPVYSGDTQRTLGLVARDTVYRVEDAAALVHRKPEKHFGGLDVLSCHFI